MGNLNAHIIAEFTSVDRRNPDHIAVRSRSSKVVKALMKSALYIYIPTHKFSKLQNLGFATFQATLYGVDEGSNYDDSEFSSVEIIALVVFKQLPGLMNQL